MARSARNPITVARLRPDEEKWKSSPTVRYESALDDEARRTTRAAYELCNLGVGPRLVWCDKEIVGWSDLVVDAAPRPRMPILGCALGKAYFGGVFLSRELAPATRSDPGVGFLEATRAYIQASDTMRLHVLPIPAAPVPEHFVPLREALDRTRDGVLHAGFAFATLDGVERLCDEMTQCRRWDTVPKRFLVGLHQAISEPPALELLRTMPASEVRVFLPADRLSKRALFATPTFHAKVLAITGGNRGRVAFLQCGSANLTGAAIGQAPKNYELSIAIASQGRTPPAALSAFRAWWDAIWVASRDADRAFIRRYASLREQLIVDDLVPAVGIEPPRSVEKYGSFFVEVGAGSGVARHQVEFPRALAAFFGRPQRRRRDITLRGPDRAWSGRPLSYKVTTYGVEIWRLGMPTQAAGGEPIADRAIRFDRTDTAGVFSFEVADTDSPQFAEWIRIANLKGHIGSTSGSRRRRYGFF